MSTHPHTSYHKKLPSHGAQTGLGASLGVWKRSPGHKHTLRAVLLADRARVIADLAWNFAPSVDISHVLAAAASHVHAHLGVRRCLPRQ